MRVLRAVERDAAWIAALLFTTTGFFISYEVVARYFFGAPTSWAAELSQLCLIWGALIAMPWVLSSRRHIRVTALTVVMPFRIRQTCEVAGMLVIVVFSATVVWYGFGIFYDSFERGRTSGTMLNLPVWIAQAAIPAGFAFLMVAAVNGIAQAVRGEIPDNSDTEPVR